MCKEAEYVALRAEILKRIELQYQLLNLALIFAGTLLTISLRGDASSNGAGGGSQNLLLLVCPPLEMFLALGWAAHNIQIAKAGVYIKTHCKEGWESFWPGDGGLSGLHGSAVKHLFTGGLPATGVFVGMEVLSLFLAFRPSSLIAASAMLQSRWFIGDVVVILLTIGFMWASNIRARMLEAAVDGKESRVDGGAGDKEEKGKTEDKPGVGPR
jgi:hypothetical protein